LQSVTLFIFSVWPTTYPREIFPLTENMNSVVYYGFSVLRYVDTPASCFPSLHVGAVFLASFIFLNESRKKFIIFLAWAALISISTLTTKQHYAVDVIAGFLLAFGMHWIFVKKISYN
jgi:membrane-associated phospholipid phosphatase